MITWKKRFLRITALLLLCVSLFGIVGNESASAASYPFIFLDAEWWGSDNPYYTNEPNSHKGERVHWVFDYYPAYKNEKITIEFQDMNGNVLKSQTKQYSNGGSIAPIVSFDMDFTGIKPGRYNIVASFQFYSYMAWHDSPRTSTFFIYVKNWSEKPGWKQTNGKWWYKNVDGSYPKSCWQTIDGKQYHFDKSGYMQTGWLQDGGQWYYLNSNGNPVTGWQKISSKWYYFNSECIMVTGTQVIDGKTYIFNSSGVMQASKWIQDGSTWYYLNSSGVYATGWQKVGSTWYYFNAEGIMLTGNQNIDGSIYFFNDSGAMQAGKWYQDGSSWYYLAGSGAAYQNKWLKSGGKW